MDVGVGVSGDALAVKKEAPVVDATLNLCESVVVVVIGGGAVMVQDATSGCVLATTGQCQTPNPPTGPMIKLQSPRTRIVIYH